VRAADAAATKCEPHRSGSPCTGDELLEGAACEPHAPSGAELHTDAISFFHRGVLDGRAAAVGEGGREGSNRRVGRVAAEEVPRRGRWFLGIDACACSGTALIGFRSTDSLRCGGVGVKLLGFGERGGLPRPVLFLRY
jgi:hypothetical protein